MRAAALSVRWRLTVVYAAVSVASAAVLLAGIYVLVSLQQGRTLVVGADTQGFVDQTVPVPPAGDGDMVIRKAIFNARADAVDRTLHNLLVWSAAGLLLMALVSVAVGWVFAGRALAPVHTITSRARRISADSLDERLRGRRVLPGLTDRSVTDPGKLRTELEHVREAVEQIIWSEREGDEAEELLDLLETRLAPGGLDDDVYLEPLETHIARICADLGLPIPEPDPPQAPACTPPSSPTCRPPDSG